MMKKKLIATVILAASMSAAVHANGYTEEEVWDACFNRYDNEDQAMACFINICTHYGCWDATDNGPSGNNTTPNTGTGAGTP